MISVIRNGKLPSTKYTASLSALHSVPPKVRALIWVVMLILVIRLFTLQLIRHDEFAQFAQANQMQRERIPAPRGFLVDRNEQVLVDNVLHFEISMSWRTRDDVAAAAAALAARLNAPITNLVACSAGAGRARP